MNNFVEKLETCLEWGGVKKDIAFIALSAIALVLSLFDLVPIPFNFAWVAIILCGLPIILEAIIGLVTEFDIKADVLVSIALIASILIGEHFAAGEVALIMQLGALLEDLTVAKAKAGIEKLVKLTPQTARVLHGDQEVVVSAEQIKVGDLLRVLPGETIPADGLITAGQTSINQAVMTGESMPVDKSAGDEVASGTVNQFGVFEMKATKVGDDSSIKRMIRLVQSADAGKAKIVRLADRWATWIVVIALTSAGLTWLFTQEIIRAVTILVVFCPCALVLATPTAIVAAIGNATKHGFLVREGDALERLASVTTVAFDKTGTLTYGIPKVLTVKSHTNLYTNEELYQIVASIEQYSEHPLGKAITLSYKKTHLQPLLSVQNFNMVPGFGVYAELGDRKIVAGNERFLLEQHIVLTDSIKKETQTFLDKGSTVIYSSMNDVCIGYLVLSDTLREESPQMLKELTALAVKPVLLTGDHAHVAHALAQKLKISQVYASCLPQDKLNHIKTLQESHEQVCMIGDGINDAPALKRADVGIAMGGIGSDIAVDAADIALVDDEIKELPHLIALSKRMMFTIKCNLSFSMGLNFIAIILAITGVLNPIVGALVHNVGSVIVIVNSSLLLHWRKNK